jgi:flagellar protein FliJ
MAVFRFQLEGVLRHRKNIEHDRQRQVALLQGQMSQLQAELRRMDQEVQGATADLRTTGLIGRLDMSYLAAHRRYVASMQRKAMTVAQRMALLQRDLDESRKALAEAAKQRKVMEKLRERYWNRWAEAMNKKEMEAMDEIGMQLSYQDLAAEAEAMQEAVDER